MFGKGATISFPIVLSTHTVDLTKKDSPTLPLAQFQFGPKRAVSWISNSKTTSATMDAIAAVVLSTEIVGNVADDDDDDGRTTKASIGAPQRVKRWRKPADKVRKTNYLVKSIFFVRSRLTANQKANLNNPCPISFFDTSRGIR